MRLEIPKRILQTGKNLEQPLRNRAVMANLRLLNPDYEYLFFDDAAVRRFIDHEFPEYRAVFDAFRFPVQRFDFFRYLAIYRYGGFYFDLDVLLAQPLSPLLSAGCVFPFEGLSFSHFLRNRYKMDWEIGNYAFGAAASHPFLEKIIENCVRSQQDPEWITPMMQGLPRLSRKDFLVLNSTGPGLLTRTLAETGGLAGQVTILFPDDVCEITNWNRFGEFGVHLMDGSWRQRGGFLRSRLTQKLENWELAKLMTTSMKQGRTRCLPGSNVSTAKTKEAWAATS